MSKTKSYNQIIFITTLSVYLGLVLVGASPQVLAQATITNKFELKDRIEQKDDLDKNEDDLLCSCDSSKKTFFTIKSLKEKPLVSFDLQSVSVFGKYFKKEISTPNFDKHTKISFENNQVFIVTRLPRGSIDSLLKL